MYLLETSVLSETYNNQDEKSVLGENVMPIIAPIIMEVKRVFLVKTLDL